VQDLRLQGYTKAVATSVNPARPRVPLETIRTTATIRINRYKVCMYTVNQVYTFVLFIHWKDTSKRDTYGRTVYTQVSSGHRMHP
jgi:hypothetical protein